MAPPVPAPPGEGGGSLPAYGEDFLQRIVKVHWREEVAGLAVEFFEGST
jgi:hypothetical protein